MLDALKFAFEILIVGALALPWLLIMAEIFSQKPLKSRPASPFRRTRIRRETYFSLLPPASRGPASIVLVIALGYLTGSIVSRVSRDLFQDELLKPLPTESQIRKSVYQDEYCRLDLIDAYWDLPDMENYEETSPQLPPPILQNTILPEVHLGTSNSPNESDTQKGRQETRARKLKARRESGEKLRQHFCPLKDVKESEAKFQDDRTDKEIQELFSFQEGELLLQGHDKVDRLKEYYDQITVLRGACLNAVILFAVCLFASLGSLRAHFPRHSRLKYTKYVLFLPAALFAYWGVRMFLHHWHDLANQRALNYLYESVSEAQKADSASRYGYPRLSVYSDPPFAESVLILLGVAGLFITAKAYKLASYVRICVIAAVVTVISYGGWWWTEVMYDLHVLHSQPELHSESPAK